MFTPDGDVVLFDFEASAHTFAPPSWDFAFLIQRFCLAQGRMPTPFTALIQETFGDRTAEIAEIMKQIAWHLVAILVDQRTRMDVIAPSLEYNKFVKLERQASQWASNSQPVY